MKFHTKNWRDDHAQLQRRSYGADGSARLTITGRYGQILCDATVCMADRNIHPSQGNVFIRDWGDNEGVLGALQANSIVGPTIRVYNSGVALPMPVRMVDGTLRIEYMIHECRLL